MIPQALHTPQLQHHTGTSTFLQLFLTRAVTNSTDSQTRTVTVSTDSQLLFQQLDNSALHQHPRCRSHMDRGSRLCRHSLHCTLPRSLHLQPCRPRPPVLHSHQHWHCLLHSLQYVLQCCTSCTEQVPPAKVLGRGLGETGRNRGSVVHGNFTLLPARRQRHLTARAVCVAHAECACVALLARRCVRGAACVALCAWHCLLGAACAVLCACATQNAKGQHGVSAPCGNRTRYTRLNRTRYTRLTATHLNH